MQNYIQGLANYSKDLNIYIKVPLPKKKTSSIKGHKYLQYLCPLISKFMRNYEIYLYFLDLKMFSKILFIETTTTSLRR